MPAGGDVVIDVFIVVGTLLAFAVLVWLLKGVERL